MTNNNHNNNTRSTRNSSNGRTNTASSLFVVGFIVLSTAQFFLASFCSFSLLSIIPEITMASAASEIDMDKKKDAASAAAIQIPTGTLYNGHVVPLVGLGTCSGVRGAHVFNALQLGYTFIDTAQSYNWGYHEDEVGTALSDYRQLAQHKKENDNSSGNGNASTPVFIQTKIHPEDLGTVSTRNAIELSLQRLQVPTIDSVLIHKPHCWEGACTKQPEGTWQDAWKILEEYYEKGIITKSIGICDVSSEKFLNELLSQKIKPHIIQNWFDPLHQDTQMRHKIQQAGILYQGYSSLGTQWKYKQTGSNPKNPVLNHHVLKEIAMNHNRYKTTAESSNVDVDVAQVIINWATTHHQISILPASSNSRRQEHNLWNSFRFTLTKEELKEIDALDGSSPDAEDDKDTTSGAAVVQFDLDPASLSTVMIDVYWVGNENNEVHAGVLSKDKSSVLSNTFYGHTFRFRDHQNNKTVIHPDFIIKRKNGRTQTHMVTTNTDDDMDNDDEEL